MVKDLIRLVLFNEQRKQFTKKEEINRVLKQHTRGFQHILSLAQDYLKETLGMEIMSTGDKYLLVSCLTETEKELLPDANNLETVCFIIVCLVYLYGDNMNKTSLESYLNKLGLEDTGYSLTLVLPVLIKQGYLTKQKEEDQEIFRLGVRALLQYPQSSIISFVLDMYPDWTPEQTSRLEQHIKRMVA